MTKREAFAKSGHSAPVVTVSPELRHVLEVFWRVKRLCNELTDAVLPNVLHSYCECQGVELSRFERRCIYALDYHVRNSLSQKRASNDRFISEKGRNGK